MTTIRKNRNRRKANRGNPIYPICGNRSAGSGHEWTPIKIHVHESSCLKCQELKEAQGSVTQSEFNYKKHASLAQFFVDLPFDDDLEDFDREIMESDIA